MGSTAHANPLVSVVLPVMNNSGTLRETLESILAQTYPNFEIIIWDDKSDFDVLGEVSDLLLDGRIRLFRSEKRSGIPGSWTQASTKALGEYVKLVCADDVISAELIEHQVRLLQSQGLDLGFASCSRGLIGPKGRILSRIPVKWKDRTLITAQTHLGQLVRSGTTPFGEPMCVLFRKEVLEKIGYWETEFEFAVDLAAYSRALLVSPAIHSSSVLAFFRIRRGQHSKQRLRVLVESHVRLYQSLQSEAPKLVSGMDVARGQLTVVLRMVVKLAFRKMIGVDHN